MTDLRKLNRDRQPVRVIIPKDLKEEIKGDLTMLELQDALREIMSREITTLLALQKQQGKLNQDDQKSLTQYCKAFKELSSEKRMIDKTPIAAGETDEEVFSKFIESDAFQKYLEKSGKKVISDE